MPWIGCSARFSRHTQRAYTVTGRLDDAAAMLGDGGVNEGFSDRLEPGQRAFLIATHEAAIAGDIRRQHRCQSSFDALGGQRIPLELESRPFASKHIGPLLD